MASRPAVGIRLGLDGKEEVKSGFEEIAASGDAATKRLVSSWEKAGTDIEQAMSRQQAAAEKIQALMTTPLQSTINASAGTSAYGGFRDAGGGSGGSNATASQYAALLKEQETRADALRMAVDPLYAAQKRYDDEIRAANGLLAQGAISEATHAAAVKQSQSALAAATRSLEGHGSALGLNNIQLQVGAASVHRFADSVLAGQSPLRAFMQQAGDVATVLQMDDGGVAGGLSKVRALLTPTNIALGATTALLAVGAAAWYSYSSSVQKLAAVSQGTGAMLGQTGEQLEADAEAAARAGNISVSAAAELEASYVRVARSGDVLVGLTAITKNFAAATGEDAKAAATTLNSIFADPIAGASELAEKYGMLSDAQVDHIAKLVEEGRQTDAQRELLRDLGSAVDGAADHVTGLAKAWDMVKNSASNAFSATGKYLNQYGPGLVFDLTGIPLPGTFDGAQASAPRQNNAAANAARARAGALTQKYQGDDRDSIQGTIGTLRAGIAAGGTPDQVKAWTEALNANEHALSTWMPAQQKASELAALDAKIAAAKTPADKDALATQRQRVELAGKVVTSADAEAQAHAKGAAALATASKAGQGHAQTLAREAAAMDASARSALDVAAAYLESGAAGEQAEARRKAITDATKKGADVDAEVRRQIALSVADGTAQSAKSVSNLRQETAARAEVDSQVSSGALAVGLMNQRLSDEATLRPLLKLQALAQGDALKTLTTVVDAYRSALAEAHDEEAHGQAIQSLDSLQKRVQDARLSLRYAGDTGDAADRARARLAGNREADSRRYNDNDRASVVAGNVAATDADLQAKRAQSAAQAVQSSRDQLALTDTEIGLIGKSVDEHDRVVARLQLQQSLVRDLRGGYAEFAPALLAAADAVTVDQQRLKQLSDAWGEVTQAGDTLINDVLSPSNWSDFGDMGKKVLGDLESELLKLAAINPLKNMLFGQSNATIGSVFSLIGGGKSVDTGFLNSTVSSGLSDFSASFVPKFAAGTDYSSGGAALVGESGPELVSMPRGSRVTNAADTRRMLSAANDGGQTNHYYLSGNLLTPEFWAQIQAGDNNAAIRGTAGGAQLSQKNAVRAQRRKLA